MMMNIIINDLSNKLSAAIKEKHGVIPVTSSWVNSWLEEKKAAFVVSIVDKDGNEIKDARVEIKERA